MTAKIDRIKNAIRHIQTAVDVDPWAIEIAVDAMEKQILQAQDVPNKNVGDTISRNAAIDCFWTKERYFRDALDVIKDIRRLPSAQSEQRWIPFILRPATDEEKEENPGWDYYLDGKLPEDGQKILITVKLPGHEEVQVDEFYSDADGSYLDGQYEIGTEAVAWMPRPKAYKEEEE